MTYIDFLLLLLFDCFLMVSDVMFLCITYINQRGRLMLKCLRSDVIQPVHALIVQKKYCENVILFSSMLNVMCAHIKGEFC